MGSIKQCHYRHPCISEESTHIYLAYEKNKDLKEENKCNMQALIERECNAFTTIVMFLVPTLFLEYGNI